MEPLVVEFAVAVSPEHAFDIWANRPALWWPRTHTVSKADDLEIIMEGHPGGRIYERTTCGTEHVWGEVTPWEPPHRLSYAWHLFFDPSEATLVEVTFTSTETGTDVRIEQSGWDRLGADGPSRRTNTGHTWAALTPLYVDACLVK